MTLIDTHAHLDGYHRDGTLPQVLSRARNAGLEGVITVGTEPEDWPLYRELARTSEGFIHHTAGLHPCAVGADWEAAVALLERHWQGGGPRPVALGECGLDRFHLPKDPADAEIAVGRQKAAFSAQLEIARRVGCPVVIHSRQAFPECVALIDASGVDWSRIVFHCFSEGPAEIAELNRRGGRASFTGILTYKNADPVRAAALAQGPGPFMVETDAPYLAPAPHRGKPNEPAYVRLVAEWAARLFGMDAGDLAAASTATARAFFRL